MCRPPVLLALLCALVCGACQRPAQQHAPAATSVVVQAAARPQRRVPRSHRAAPATGGWIVVAATNVAGAPLGPLQAWRRRADSKRAPLVRMPAPVLDAAGYLWTVPAQGVYYFYLKAPGHVLVREYDAVWLAQTTTLAVTFEPLGDDVPVITGIVRDVQTRMPLANVSLRALRAGSLERITAWSPRTEPDGTFRIVLDPNMTALGVEFARTGYYPVVMQFRPAALPTNMPTVWLAPPAHVHVTAFDVDGQPLTNVLCRLALPRAHQQQPLCGATTFSNVPAGVAMQCTIWRAPRCLAGMPLAPVAPAQSTTVVVRLARPGRLIVRFSEAVSSNWLGESICLRGIEQTTNKPPERFSAENLVAQRDFWLRDNLSPGVYALRTWGTNIVALETNITVHSEEDTILDLCAGPHSLGVIRGWFDCGSGMPVGYHVRARCRDAAHICATDDDDGTNVFCVGGLDAQRMYDLLFTVMIGLRPTNVVVANVRPNDAPLQIVLERTFFIRGVALDPSGAPVEIRPDGIFGILLARTKKPGAFVYGPVPVGLCRFCLRVRGYAPYLQDVPVRDRDVELGTIVLTRGLTLRGRVLDADGEPCPRADLGVVRLPCASLLDIVSAAVGEGEVDDDGYFCVSNVPPGVRIGIAAMLQDDAWSFDDVGALNMDRDIGTLRLRAAPWYEVTLRAPSEAMNFDLTILGLRRASDDMLWTGKAPITLGLFDGLVLMPEESELGLLNATVVPCPTGFAPTNRFTVDMPPQWYRQCVAPPAD